MKSTMNFKNNKTESGLDIYKMILFIIKVFFYEFIVKINNRRPNFKTTTVRTNFDVETFLI